MTVRDAGPTAAAFLAPLAAMGFDGPALVSLGAGMVAVWVSRLVFIDRENQRLQRRQTWRETVPITMAAMLITGAVIFQAEMGVAPAIYTGLGIGWAAVVLLDILGRRAVDIIRTAVGAGPADPALPPQADLSGHDGRVATPGTDLGDLSQPTPGGGPSLGELLDRISESEERSRRNGNDPDRPST